MNLRPLPCEGSALPLSYAPSPSWYFNINNGRLSNETESVPADGYGHTYHPIHIDEIIGSDIPQGELNEMKQHFQIKDGKIVLKYPRIISSLLVSELLKTLTQGGMIT